MDMQKYVFDTLKEMDITISYVARGESRLPLIVFNVTSERGKQFWDDEERVVKYSVMINIFSRDNFVTIKQEVLNRMLKAGFIRKEIPACIYIEDIEVYNQPMAFDFYYEIEEKTEDGKELKK
ncbi:hypothetical protein UT300009_30870 [Paraclostridium bifermentans]